MEEAELRHNKTETNLHRETKVNGAKFERRKTDFNRNFLVSSNLALLACDCLWFLLFCGGLVAVVSTTANRKPAGLAGMGGFFSQRNRLGLVVFLYAGFIACSSGGGFFGFGGVLWRFLASG
jgi:hypothetical protein